MSTRKKTAAVDFLPSSVRRGLMEDMGKAKFPEKAVEAFLDDCQRSAKDTQEQRLRVTQAKEKKQLIAIAMKAHRLLNALNAVHPRTLERMEDAADRLFDLKGGELLPKLRHYVDGGMRAAERAASQLNPDAHVVTEATTARTLTWGVVASYKRHFDELPPLNKDSWFVPFMKRLGEHLKIKCGPDVVGSVIRAARRRQ